MRDQFYASKQQQTYAKAFGGEEIFTIFKVFSVDTTETWRTVN